MSLLSDARRFLWHIRAGGPRQVKTWLERRAFEAGHRRLETVRGAEGVWVGRGKSRQLRFKPAVFPVPSTESRILPRVAVILDEFSASALSQEWDCLHLFPKSWREQLQAGTIDLLFVESAWSGRGHQWAGKISGADHSSSVLRDVTQWCGEHGVPTVFWNKEDPPHYDDFLAAAKLFDHVFTSDASRIPAYLSDLKHDRVDVLPFAAQPVIHNPVRPKDGWHERDVAFAGMYFENKYPERKAQLEIVLAAAKNASAKMDIGLEIFSRQFGGDAKYQFPPEFANHVVGSLDYPEMVTAYKAFKTFLNVNSVVDSPTMCPRRIFEIVASGTNVITTGSDAIGTHFAPDEIFTVGTQQEAESLLLALHRNPALGERQLHRGQRRIWREHTYSHRSNKVLAATVPHLAQGVRRPTVSAMVSTMRPWQLEHIFQTVGSQIGVSLQLVLLTHGFEPDRGQVDILKDKYGVEDVKFLTADATRPLGECLNVCVAAADGEVLTKMDDDDYYAPNYLSDQLYALEYSKADLVGKQAHYMHLKTLNATVLRFAHWEHRYTRSIMGPTIMGSAEIFRANPFADIGSGEDTAFLRRALSAGGSIYAADRFNYCQQRSSDGHTWKVSEESLLATGDVKFFGNYIDEVSV